MRPRPAGSKSSTVSLSTRIGCAGRPHVLWPEMYTPLSCSQSSILRSRSAVGVVGGAKMSQRGAVARDGVPALAMPPCQSVRMAGLLSDRSSIMRPRDDGHALPAGRFLILYTCNRYRRLFSCSPPKQKAPGQAQGVSLLDARRWF